MGYRKTVEHIKPLVGIDTTPFHFASNNFEQVDTSEQCCQPGFNHVYCLIETLVGYYINYHVFFQSLLIKSITNL